MMKIEMGNYSYTEDEIISAIAYMYGIYGKEVVDNLNANKYTENEIKRAILYQETEGIEPYKMRRKVFENSLKRWGVE